MATHIAISAGGAGAVDGSNVNLAFGTTTIVLTAHSATPPTDENKITPATNCTWAVLDVPKGTTFDASWFDTNTAGWPNVNTLPTASAFTPDKEGTWLFRCTNSDGTVDEVAVGIRHQRTDIRVPAAGETTEANSTRGWAEDRNDDLDVFDDLVTSGGIQLCRFVSASAGAAGTLVQFNGNVHDINPTSAVEFIPEVEPSSNTNPGTGRYLGVIKAKKDGTTTSIASGSLVWVSRAGMVEGATGGTLDLSAFAAGESVYVGSVAGAPAQATDVDTATATMAGIVIRNTNPGAILATPVNINNVLLPKASGTVRDAQIVEIDIFEAPISGHNLYNTSTDSSSANRGFKPYGGSANSPLDLPGARLQNVANATDVFLTSIALDERCVREGASEFASNWMEYPLVLQVHGYSDGQTAGATLPTIGVRMLWNFSGVASNGAEANLVLQSVPFITPSAADLSYKGTSGNLELIFKSPLFKGVDFNFGIVGNDYDNLSSDTTETAYDTPPCSVDLRMARADSETFDIIITKVVLKALYPTKSRAKRLSFYEKQIPGAALIASNGHLTNATINYASVSNVGGPYVNVFESDDAADDGINDFSAETISGNMRGETAAELVGYFPFDNRLRLDSTHTSAATNTQALRFRTISKFKSTVTDDDIKLQLSLRGETHNLEFTSLDVDSGTPDYEASVSVSSPVLTDADEYRTIIHDWSIPANTFDPDINGVRFKIVRQAASGASNLTVDDELDVDTGEKAFCISSAVLSEENLSITKSTANVFEEHIQLDRQIDYNDGASNISLTGDCSGFVFAKGGSETLVVPIQLDERYDEQSDLTVDVTGYITDVAGSITMLLQAASAYVDERIPEFSTIGKVSINTSTAFVGANIQRVIKHSFTVPFSTIAKTAGIPDDNLSTPLEERRGCLYLKLTRLDSDGPNNYFASHLSAIATINKVPNADPYIDISENSSYPILVPGGYRHDDQRDILTTVYRHNWQFGLPNEMIDTDVGSGGVEDGDEVMLLPSNLLNVTPPISLNVTSGSLTGKELVGKHVPFSMVITAIHGYMVQGIADGSDIYGQGIGPTSYIELLIFEMCNSGNTGNSDAQATITSEHHSGVIGFPFKILPSSDAATGVGGGIIRVVGNDLSTNASGHDGTILPRVYLPADYAGRRQWMMGARFHNGSGTRLSNALIDLNVEVAFLANTTGTGLIY